MAGKNGLTLSGVAAIKRRLQAARGRVPSILHAATEEAMAHLEEAAKRILEQEIYNKPHAGEDAPDAGDPDSLYNSFLIDIAKTARAAVSGKLINTSEHAPFLEFGTDNEGTGSHFVPVVNGKALHWVNPTTGQSSFSRGHEVKGIVPIRFLERALHQERAAVLAIFKDHFKDLF